MYQLREFNSQYNTENWSTAYIVSIPSRAKISLHALKKQRLTYRQKNRRYIPVKC